MSTTKERFIADTSYVSAAKRISDRRADYGWSRLTLARLRAARIAVSVVSVGESRAGTIRDAVAASDVRAFERWFSRFPSVDVDDAIAHVWARLQQDGHRHGLTFSDNDLWIAATAQTLGVPIVTCDRAFARMPGLDVEVVYLPSSRVAAEELR